MIKKYLPAIGAIALLAFTTVGVANVKYNQEKVELQKIQLEDRGAELKQLQLHYTRLNDKLDAELQKEAQDKQKIQELEAEKQRLEQEKSRLEAELRAKRAKQQQDSQIAVRPPGGAANASGAKLFIYMKESGNNPGAVNPSSGACGLGQALPCSKMPCSLSDYACQDAFFTQYMQNRYGTWENAVAFWQRNRWWWYEVIYQGMYALPQAIFH